MPIVKPTPGRRHAPAPGLSGLWLFNEYTGAALDLSGNRRDLAVVSTPVRTAGVYGREVAFVDNPSYFVGSGAPAEWQTAASPTVTVMLKWPTTPPTGSAGIVMFTNPALNYGWGFLTYSESGVIVPGWWTQSIGRRQFKAVSPGYHVLTGTYDAPSGVMEFWVDGAYQGAYTPPEVNTTPVTQGLRVSGFDGVWRWEGGVVAVAIHTRRPNVPRLHADWLSGRFVAPAPPIFPSPPFMPGLAASRSRILGGY